MVRAIRGTRHREWYTAMAMVVWKLRDGMRQKDTVTDFVAMIVATSIAYISLVLCFPHY